MNLYVVRHGQTEANVKHLFNGINEGDLTSIGVKQAEELLPAIESINIDCIFCSPLTRALHTASILNVNNKPIYKDKRIIERDCGEYTLKPVDLIQDKSVLYDLDDNTYKEFESFSSIIKRVKSFISELKEKYENENILIVTHGDIILGIQEYLNKKTDEYPKTCELIKFEL